MEEQDGATAANSKDLNVDSGVDSGVDRRAEARSLIDAFRTDDAAERGHRAAMLSLLDQTDDPFARNSVRHGHFTASAFVVHKGHLLLIWHRKLLRWLQPGGHVDPEDTDLQAAAVRELAEETGISTARCVRLLDVDVHPIPANPARGEPAHRHHDVRFLFESDSRDAVAASDAGDVKWVRFADINSGLTDASVVRAVAKLSD